MRIITIRRYLTNIIKSFLYNAMINVRCLKIKNRVLQLCSVILPSSPKRQWFAYREFIKNHGLYQNLLLAY